MVTSAPPRQLLQTREVGGNTGWFKICATILAVVDVDNIMLMLAEKPDKRIPLPKGGARGVLKGPLDAYL